MGGLLVLKGIERAPVSAYVPVAPELVESALAAGYKASFLCSDLFNGDMQREAIEQDDLARTYSELEPLFDQLEAKVDRTNARVLVPYADDMPPRVAQWRRNLGCAQLPIGAPPETASRLPSLELLEINHRAADTQSWPQGDARATARPKGNAAALNRAVAAAFDRRTYGQGSETTAVLVVQDGRSMFPEGSTRTNDRPISSDGPMRSTIISATDRCRLPSASLTGSS